MAATATDSQAASAIAETAPATPGTAENPTAVSDAAGPASDSPAALSDRPAPSATSTEAPGAPEAAPLLQPSGTAPLETARSEGIPPEPAPPPAEPQPDPEPAAPEPEPEPKTQTEPEPEPEPEPPEPPERRGAAVVSEYCWSSDQPGRVMLMLGRRSPDSGVISLPPGWVQTTTLLNATAELSV